MFWSSVGGKPYPVSLRVHSFEQAFAVRDPRYTQPPGNTFSKALLDQFRTPTRTTPTAPANTPVTRPTSPTAQGEEPPAAPSRDLFGESDSPRDILAEAEHRAAEALQRDAETLGRINGPGIAWGAMNAYVKRHLPEAMDDRDALAFQLVPKVLTRVFGKQGQGWKTFKNDAGKTYVKSGGA